MAHEYPYILRLSIGLFLLICMSAVHGDWHDRKAEGWAWYEEKQSKTSDLSTETKQDLPNPSPSDTIQTAREALQEKLSKALLEPTQENVLAYMEEQQKWTEKSSQFAQTWTRLLLQNPLLDYTVTERPVSQYALQHHKQQFYEQKNHLISSLAKDYGLFFFYKGHESSSELFGRIVHALSEKYDLSMIAISVDGMRLPGFPNIKEDNGISQTLGVDIYPALYLINPQEDIAVPISFGLVSLDEIENNIVLQFKDSVGGNNA